MIIEYCKQQDNFFDILPAKNFLPQWYTCIKNDENINAKMCMPFLDSFLTGYIVQSSYDIDVENGNVVSKNVAIREPKTIQTPTGYFEKEYMWSFLYNIKIENNYSILITHPLNRYDLPFITLSGIVDVDDIMVHGSLTFFIKNGFSGKIVAGTPVAQLIPIKRESWELFYNNNLKEIGKNRYLKSSFTKNLYRNNFWHRKEYK